MRACPTCGGPLPKGNAVYCSRLCQCRGVWFVRSFWQPDVDARLTELWAAKIPARIIADILGAKSRSAVIGRANRLGLAKPTKSSTTRKQRRIVLETTPEPVPADGVPFLELSPRGCRWPLGPLRQRSETFCGARACDGSSYCEAHRRKAYDGFSRKAGKSYDEIGAERKRVNRLLRTGTYV